MSENDRGRAEGLIRAAERDLKRKLSRGEMRDLLTDRTRWPRDKIFGLVAVLFPERDAPLQEVGPGERIERGRA